MIVAFARHCAEVIALALFVAMVGLWASLLTGGFAVA